MASSAKSSIKIVRKKIMIGGKRRYGIRIRAIATASKK